MLEILLGQLPEAIYFALFMIYTKDLKEKRILFITLMSVEYILLINILPYSVWFHVLYTAVMFFILKLLYKERAQVTDIFTFGVASLSVVIISLVAYIVLAPIMNYTIIANIIQKIILFVGLYLLRNKLPYIQKLYKHLWNRNDNKKKPMKSATFRAINVVIFNISFVAINLGVTYYWLFRR